MDTHLFFINNLRYGSNSWPTENGRTESVETQRRDIATAQENGRDIMNGGEGGREEAGVEQGGEKNLDRRRRNNENLLLLLLLPNGSGQRKFFPPAFTVRSVVQASSLFPFNF